MIKKISIVLAIPLLFAACARDPRSEVGRNGNCSKETVVAYRSIFRTAKVYNKAKSTDDLVSVHNACSDFQASVGNGSCKARQVSTKKLVRLSYSDVAETCSTVDAFVEGQLDESLESENEL